MHPIFIAASPNTEKDDVRLARRLLSKPARWFDKSKTDAFEADMARYLGENTGSVAFDSARSSFYLIMKLYGVKPGDEVIIPSFSCLVIANPILWLGAKPVYVDIDPDTYNMDLEDLKKKITIKTKVILIQHTFGTIIDVEKVRNIAGPDIKLIEDVAHTLGMSVNGHKVGTLADSAILTFGIEKAISSVRGGMAVTSDEELYNKLKEVQTKLPDFTKKRVKISLMNPIYWEIMRKIYYIGIGKMTLGRLFTWLGHKYNLLGNMIEECEYDAVQPKWFPAKLPGALAELGSHQLSKIDYLNAHRLKISKIYEKELGSIIPNSLKTDRSFLRYPVRVKNLKLVTQILKKEKIVAGDWYQRILFSPAEKLAKFGYKIGETPIAEKITKEIINLPTNIHVSEARARQIAGIVKEFCI
jgi:perosamine synthetase